MQQLQKLTRNKLKPILLIGIISTTALYSCSSEDGSYNSLPIEPEIVEVIDTMIYPYVEVTESDDQLVVRKNDGVITKDSVYVILNLMPEYPGGNTALSTFLSTNLIYPAEAKQKSIQGRVYINFIVAKDGSIINSRVVRGIDPLLDNEALRVIKIMPKWNPGVKDGKPVDVSYVIPINFKLM